MAWLSTFDSLIFFGSAGGPIKDDHSPETLHVPPLGIMLHQQMTEKLVKEGDGDTRRVRFWSHTFISSRRSMKIVTNIII